MRGIREGECVSRITPFQRSVYDACSEIPPGRVTTYARLASRIGCRCARAVGQALRRNPFAPRVPCHRVIASNLTLGGFSGSRSGPEIARKARLLAAEGVAFDRLGRLADPARLHAFTRKEGPKSAGAHRHVDDARRRLWT